jgi:hypothetical protein
MGQQFLQFHVFGVAIGVDDPEEACHGIEGVDRALMPVVAELFPYRLPDIVRPFLRFGGGRVL